MSNGSSWWIRCIIVMRVMYDGAKHATFVHIHACIWDSSSLYCNCGACLATLSPLFSYVCYIISYCVMHITDWHRKWTIQLRRTMHHNVFGCICLPVCLSCLCSHCWKHWPRNFLFRHTGTQVHLQNIYVKVQCKGHRVKVKVNVIRA